jgi:hypothetical protein
MSTLKIYIGADDGDVQEIIDGLDGGERSQWVRDAIRAYAGARAPHRPVATTDQADVVAALNRSADILVGIQLAQGASSLAIPCAGDRQLPVKEDEEAAAMLDNLSFG